MTKLTSINFINDFKQRWLKIFEEMKSEAIPESEFDIIFKFIKLEISEFRAYDYAEKGEQKKHENIYEMRVAENTVLSYLYRTKAICSSKWKHEHNGIFDRLFGKTNVTFDFGFLKLGGKK
jgi:hypothetical protein